MMDDRYGYGIVHASTVPEPLMFIWMLGLLALIIVGIVLAVRYFGGGTHLRHGAVQSPLEVLNMRYAKGEIDRAEYDTIKKSITAASAPESPEAKTTDEK